MAVSATVVDGKVVQNNSQNSLSGATAVAGKSGMDKDSFLQLLVAQMKYQDPLEPTSNTEYISQYAQFTQVEAMQSMNASMDLQRASGLVGQEVYVKVLDKAGETKLLQGKVDYVVYENGKAFLSIEEALYPMEDLYTVADGSYMEAFKKATEWITTLNKLPNVNNISIGDGATIDKLKESYDKMTDYEKTFIAKEKVEVLNKLTSKLEELRKQDASAWNNTLKGLPEVDEITVAANGTAIDELKAKYDKMDAKEKAMISEESVELLNKYVGKLEELRKQEGSDGK